MIKTIAIIATVLLIGLVLVCMFMYSVGVNQDREKDDMEQVDYIKDCIKKGKF